VLAAERAQRANDPDIDASSEQATSYMSESVLGFNEQIEHLSEVALVLCLGAMLAPNDLPRAAWWFIPLLLFGIRPVAVALGLVGSASRKKERWLMAFLGIRGIGSVYYLMNAIGYGLSDQFSRQLVSLVVFTVAVSIFLHGIVAPPLMRMADKK
jgi:NhaP-type Na+/H+ or K+/H+ antiporter